MTLVVINPGSGPVLGAYKRKAISSMRRLVREAGAKWKDTRDLHECEEGRYRFAVNGVDVWMPGLDAEILKQNKLVPRLYVDGSSWWWKYAVDILIAETSGGQ